MKQSRSKNRASIDPASIPLLRRRVYLALAAIVVPLVLFGLAEVGLRLAGIGYPASFFLRTSSGTLVENQQFSWRFFPKALARSPRPMQITAVKAPETVRVFVFGESAAYGDPEPAFGLPRVLETLLRERFPEKRFEVVNVAMTAINSNVILPIARDCADKDGDVWILYIGNNEVVGPYGAGTVFNSQSPPLPLIRAAIALKKTRLAQALDLAAQRMRSAKAGPQMFTGMEMFSENRLAADDPRMGPVYSHFASNLRDIVETGLRSKAEVILCTMGVNLRDCAPFGSTNRVSLSEEEKAQWNKSFTDGAAAQKQGDFGRAAEAYRAAIKVDDHHAELLFRLAQCEWARTNRAEGAQLFARARDADALRFRADSRENEIIREVARTKPEVHLVDIEKRMGSAPGGDYFYEHVHFTFAGNYSVARAMAEEIGNSAPTLKGVKTGEWLTEEQCAARLALTDWNRLKTAEILRKRTSRPPFTFQFDHAEREARSLTEIRALKEGLDAQKLQEASEIFRRAIELSPEDWVLRENYAEILAALGDIENAALQSQQVVARIDHHAEKWAQLGGYLQKARHPAEAAEAFDTALRLEARNAEALFGLALVKLDQRATEEALDLLNRSLHERPVFSEARVVLGEALANRGETNQAIAEFERVLEMEPGHAKARAALNRLRFGSENLKEQVTELSRLVLEHPQDGALATQYGRALTANGQLDEARKQFETALKLEPWNGEAHYFYAELLTRQNLTEQALEHFGKAAQLMPEDFSAHLNFGVALAQGRRFREASEQFEEALRIDPSHKQAQEYAALTKARLK